MAQIDALIRRWLAEGVYSGAGLIIHLGGRGTHERYFGDMNSDSAVHVASAGKWMAAATCAALVDEGLLGWDDPASRYVPGLDPLMARATLAQLLSHTAGYPDYQPHGAPSDHYQTLADSVTHIRPLRAISAPGTHFFYGGLAMQVAGRMAEVAAQQSWADIFATRIARPLDMGRTAFTPVSPEQGFGPMLGGGLHSSARDFHSFLQMVRSDGLWRGRRILSPGAIAALEADHVRDAQVPPLAYVDQARATHRQDIYGLGLWREEVDETGRPTLLSSPGWAGAYPWIDRHTGSFGVFLAKVDVERAKAKGFNAFLSSPVLPWLVRDALADADAADLEAGHVQIAGGSLYWEAHGAGDPLILLHDHGLDRTMWDPQFTALKGHGRIIRYDLRGYGRSSHFAAAAPCLHADDLLALMDALQIERAHLVGQSLGGSVVADMLALYPHRLFSAVVAGGDASRQSDESPMTRTIGKDVAALPEGGIWAVKRNLLDHLTHMGGAHIQAVRPKLWEMLSKWPTWQSVPMAPGHLLEKNGRWDRQPNKLNVPILLLHTRAFATETMEPTVYREFSRQAVFLDTGHVANLEQPENFTQILIDFLRFPDRSD